jgi:GNAT superfamily N-acetyltransferase
VGNGDGLERQAASCGLRAASEQIWFARGLFTTMKSIDYRYGNDLEVHTVIELYNASGLGERRPVDDSEIFADMLRHANLTVTAWDEDALVGISRTLTDFSYVGYLSDLAVRRSHQKFGIGTKLIQRTREKMGPRSMLVLLSAPQAIEYYPRMGFTQHPSAWVLRAGDRFPK